jgi:hypothetical protein
MSGPLIGMRRETGWAGGDARERPVLPARSAGLPRAVLGTGDVADRPRPGSVPVVLPSRRQSLPLAGPARGVAPCPVARAPRADCCPAGSAAACRRPGCAAAASRSSSPGGVPGDLAGCAAGIRRGPGTPARCLAARACRRPASAAGARTVSRLMPATGSGRDAVPGPAPDDRPAPPSRAAGSGHDTGAAATCAFTAMAGIWRGCPGHPRSCRHGLAGLALAGCQCLLRAAVSPHRPLRAHSNLFESCRSSWSPVTESNHRPSPYHAFQFGLRASDWVGLPQVGGISVSRYIALSRPLPGAVVTWFVTGRLMSPEIRVCLHGRRASRAGTSGALSEKARTGPPPAPRQNLPLPAASQSIMKITKSGCSS